MSNNPHRSQMSLSDDSSATFLLRWRGRQEGPYTAAVIEAKLAANQIGLLHEIAHNGQWVTLRKHFAHRKAILQAELLAKQERERQAREVAERRAREVEETLARQILQQANANAQKRSNRTAIPSEVRREVWRRDQGQCAKCGSRENLEYDHIVPVSQGGSNTARNVELLCEGCNRSKSDSIE